MWANISPQAKELPASLATMRKEGLNTASLHWGAPVAGVQFKAFLKALTLPNSTPEQGRI